MSRLVLIHPVTRRHSAGFAESDAWHMPPLALAYVAAVTPPGWDIRIVDEYVEPIDTSIPADLVGITAYTANATRAYELAAAFRERGVPVVLGGIHGSMCPDEALRFVDAVVIGEAEPVWAEVVADVERGRLKRRYVAERRPLGGLPIPRRDLLAPHYGMEVIQTTRGCPFGCEFCSVTAFNGGEYRRRPTEEVLDEMEGLKGELLYLVDDNIIGTGPESRRQALALFRGMTERGLRKKWVTQCSINIADDEDVLEAARLSGCKALYVGFESVMAENLRAMRKGVNLRTDTEGMIRAVARIHAHGMAVIGSFVIGHDHDEAGTTAATLRFMHRAKIDVIQLSYLTPFPGTDLFRRLSAERRIICTRYPDDWDLCDTDHVMIRPLAMDVVELVHGFDYIVRGKLSRLRILSDAFRTLALTRSLTAAVLSLNFNMGCRNALDPRRAFTRAVLRDEDG